MRFLVIFVFIATFFYSCIGNASSEFAESALERMELFNKDTSNKIFKEFINCSADIWINNTSFYNYGGLSDEYYEIRVPFIYYNRDSSKFIGILISKKRKDDLFFDNYANPLDSFTYNYQMVIAIKDSGNFIIAPMGIKYGIGEISWDGATLSAMYFLEFELAEKSITVNHPQRTLRHIKYNVLDDLFWDKCILFSKGIRASGNYYFQNGDNFQEIIYPPNPCANQMFQFK